MESMALNRIPEWQFLQFGGIRIAIQRYNFFLMNLSLVEKQE